MTLTAFSVDAHCQISRAGKRLRQDIQGSTPLFSIGVGNVCERALRYGFTRANRATSVTTDGRGEQIWIHQTASLDIRRRKERRSTRSSACTPSNNDSSAGAGLRSTSYLFIVPPVRLLAPLWLPDGYGAALPS